MIEGVDIGRLGERLQRTRKKRKLTLKEVADETGITIPTLSRIERGQTQDIKSATLLALTDWMGTSVDKFKEGQPSAARSGRDAEEEVPDIVELHLRADKKLDKQTATVLSKMFRAAYDQAVQQQTKE